MENVRLIKIERLINAFMVLSLLILSFIGFAYQLMLAQSPCPLCLLERVGFLAMAFGLLLNLRFGLRPSHYSLVLLSALLTSLIALRQIALSSNGNYGGFLFGFHLQTWTFVCSLLIVVSCALILGFGRHYEAVYPTHSYWRSITFSLFVLLAILLLANTITAIMYCGLAPCPEIGGSH